MTEKTKTVSVRLKIKDYERLRKHLTREKLERLLEQLDKGGLVTVPKKDMGILEILDFMRVNTKSESVNTDCDECPYKNDLNMNGFDEVCDTKGLDRQKALDKCVQMLWR